MKETIIKPCRKPYVVFGVITGGGTLLSFVVAVSAADPSWWEAVFIFSLITLLVMVWISSNRIIITDDHVTYKSLFKGRVSLPLSQIKSAQILVGVFKYADRSKPTVRLEVKTSDKELNIPLKLFDHADLEPLFDLLGVK